MSALIVRRRRIAWLRIPILALAAAVLSAGAARAADPVSSAVQPIAVHVDQARVLKVPLQTVTLIVGNPLIADVSIQSGGIMVLTGKGYGVTNLIALDRNGGILLEHPVEVQSPRDELIVSVYRGVNRESYSCAAQACERRITLGDSAEFFTATMGQASALNTQAQGGQQSSK